MIKRLQLLSLIALCIVCLVPATAKDSSDLYSAEMAANLPGIVGKALYANAYCQLFKGDTNEKDLKQSLTLSKEVNLKGIGLVLKQAGPLEVPLLEPLMIRAAEYLPKYRVVMLHLQAPNGKEFVYITTPAMLDHLHNGEPFLNRVAGQLMTGMPTGLTEQEIQAVKNRSFYKGMSEGALGLALGAPEHVNASGDGTKQLVYYDGSMFVYTDSKGKVENWQTLSK